MSSNMRLKDLKIYFEERIDPDFYFFNPMHGYQLKIDAFEYPVFTLYQCAKVLWQHFEEDHITDFFELCVTTGSYFCVSNNTEFHCYYFGVLGSHSETLKLIEELKLECIYFVQELTKVSVRNSSYWCLEEAKNSLKELLERQI